MKSSRRSGLSRLFLCSPSQMMAWRSSPHRLRFLVMYSWPSTVSPKGIPRSRVLPPPSWPSHRTGRCRSGIAIWGFVSFGHSVVFLSKPLVWAYHTFIVGRLQGFSGNILRAMNAVSVFLRRPFIIQSARRPSADGVDAGKLKCSRTFGNHRRVELPNTGQTVAYARVSTGRSEEGP